MGLPKINEISMSKKVHLPVLDRDVTVNAFTIKEERILMLKKSTDDKPEENKDLEKTLIELISKKIDGAKLEELTYIDMIVIMSSILEISKGGIQTLEYVCQNTLEDGSVCNTPIVKEVNISDYVIDGDISTRDYVVQISDEIAIKFTFPKFVDIVSIKSDDAFEYSLGLICASIKEVLDKGESVEFKREELKDWIESLPASVLNKVKDYFDKLPSVKISYDLVCPNCGYTKKMEINSLMDFFY